MKKKQIRFLMLLSALFLMAGCGASEPVEEPEFFSVDILSTGKSDCILIRMDGKVWLNDTADEDDFPAIRELLDEYGIRTIDAVILSHYDKDHIGSAAEILRSYSVGRLYGPDYRENSELYEKLSVTARKAGVPWEKLTETLTLETERGKLVLDPPDRDYGDDNNNSLVTILTFEEKNFLFLGDALNKRMKEQLTLPSEELCFVKLPHHGDSGKALLELIHRTPPNWAAVTADSPDDTEPELRDALQEAGTEFYCSGEGRIHITFRDGEAKLIQYKFS